MFTSSVGSLYGVLTFGSQLRYPVRAAAELAIDSGRRRLAISGDRYVAQERPFECHTRRKNKRPLQVFEMSILRLIICRVVSEVLSFPSITARSQTANSIWLEFEL